MIMKQAFTLIFLFLLLVSCRHSSKNHEVTESSEPEVTQKAWAITASEEWGKNQGMLNVESIVYDFSNEVFYITNGLDYKQGTQGFISRLSKNGELLELKWVVDLNRPTGMAIQDSVLYVADINALLAINTRTGKIIKKFPEPIPNSGLNDISINAKGEVYVSASFVHAVFKCHNDTLKVWKQDGTKLKWANGLIARNDHVFVGGLGFNSIRTNSKKIDSIPLNSPIKDFDGVVADDSGGFFLTTVENSGLYHANADGQVDTLLVEETYFGDLEFNPNQKKLYIPRGDHKTQKYFISVFTLEEKNS